MTTAAPSNVFAGVLGRALMMTGRSVVTLDLASLAQLNHHTAERRQVAVHASKSIAG